MHFDKRGPFERAKKLIADGDETSLRYACLELRLVLEAIIYKKVGLFLKKLPPDVLATTWQPPQLLRAMKEMDPHADKNFTLRMSPESSPGVATGQWFHMGDHKALSASRLRTLYNKLGSFLHCPTKWNASAGHAGIPKKSDLEMIVLELEPVVDNDFDATFSTVIEFECEKCGRLVIRNSERAESTKRADCLNPECKAQYFITKDGGNYDIRLMVSSFDCGNCKEPILLENRFLEIGYTFDCKKCGTKHQMLSKQWGYGYQGDESKQPKSDDSISDDERP